ADTLVYFAPMEMGGDGEGRLPRSRQYRLGIRALRQKPIVRTEATERRVAEDLCEARPLSGVHAVQRLPARSLRVSILRRQARSDIRPSRSAIPRRANAMG